MTLSVSIVGSGYVGTTVAACLADLGHDVVNVEIDDDIVDAINAGETPIHEPGLAERIAKHAGDRLRATTDYAAIRETDVTFLCLPTPQTADGHLDLSAMRSAARSVGNAIAERQATASDPTHTDTEGDTTAFTDTDAPSHLTVVKSTVLPGTTAEVVGPLIEKHAGQPIGEGLELAVNPEFLRMGTAVEDFLSPDKIVIGVEDDASASLLRDLYAPILAGEAATGEGAEPPHLVETNLREAELIKYANNAFLAAKISLVNELGNIAKCYDADAYDVLAAVGLDDRISSRFLRSGLGWGGSCFPKDVNALRAGAREVGYDPALLDAVVAVNDGQPHRLVELLSSHVVLDSARIAVLGLSFKPHTDDVRESRALDVIDLLLERGAIVVAYDPVATSNVRTSRPEFEDAEVRFADAAEEALDGADGAVVATGWPEFDDLSFEGMARRVLIDGRRIDVDEDALEVYEGLTW